MRADDDLVFRSLPICEAHWLGRIAYQRGVELQNETAAELLVGKRHPALLLMEHPHTYTFGRGGHPENLLLSQEELAARGIGVYFVDRGGDVTYHGPGQLVGYPILRLPRGDEAGGTTLIFNSVGYLRKLEDALILALARLGLRAGRRDRLTGVWVEGEDNPRRVGPDSASPFSSAKIASIGVRVDSSGITRHGFALNVAPEQSYWKGIVPCGLEGVVMTSLAELLNPCPSMETVAEQVVKAFGEVLGFEMRWALPLR
ncbi:MAG: lipoyl(octanoyl) transferase LipB [Anaerolineae bacterium]|nr:lipoyl(octanoyl) transferase LipB [Anaerolineae bacterium]